MAAPEIVAWDDLKAEEPWETLLLGNGASINIWPRFRYASLLEVASALAAFSSAARRVFAEFRTHDFEEVLRCLSVAQRVQSARRRPKSVSRLDTLHETVRKGLIGAVHRTHIRWLYLDPLDVLERFGEALLAFKSVFSINYDLLVYWSRMRSRESSDGFWGGAFDPLDTSFGKKDTDFFYLHGGLHLFRDERGRTFKRKHEDGSTILEQFEQHWEAHEIPLIVTEGDAEEKLSRIRASEYLSHAFRELRSNRGPVVVFGSSISEFDRHIWDALDAGGRGRTIAVSVTKIRDPAKQHARIQAALPHAVVRLFLAETHPLGDPRLGVK